MFKYPVTLILILLVACDPQKKSNEQTLSLHSENSIKDSATDNKTASPSQTVILPDKHNTTTPPSQTVILPDKHNTTTSPSQTAILSDKNTTVSSSQTVILPKKNNTITILELWRAIVTNNKDEVKRLLKIKSIIPLRFEN